MSNNSPFSRCDDASGVAQPGRVTGRDLIYVGLFRANAYAGGEVIWLNFGQRGDDLFASLNSIRATRMKAAALWGVDWRRHIAFQNDALARRFNLRVWNGNG